jgi:hypothetical protein
MNPAESPASPDAPVIAPAVAPCELCSQLRDRMRNLKAYAHRQPAQAVTAAFGAGLLIHLLPTRGVTGALSTVGAAVLRPLLISLGITKAIELTCKVSPLTPKP